MERIGGWVGSMSFWPVLSVHSHTLCAQSAGNPTDPQTRTAYLLSTTLEQDPVGWSRLCTLIRRAARAAPFPVATRLRHNTDAAASICFHHIPPLLASPFLTDNHRVIHKVTLHPTPHHHTLRIPLASARQDDVQCQRRAIAPWSTRRRCRPEPGSPSHRIPPTDTQPQAAHDAWCD